MLFIDENSIMFNVFVMQKQFTLNIYKNRKKITNQNGQSTIFNITLVTKKNSTFMMRSQKSYAKSETSF